MDFINRSFTILLWTKTFVNVMSLKSSTERNNSIGSGLYEYDACVLLVFHCFYQIHKFNTIMR